MRIDRRAGQSGARALGFLVAVLVAAFEEAATAQVLTVNRMIGSVTVSPLLRETPFTFHPGLPPRGRPERLITVAWVMPTLPRGAAPVIPGITLHVTERRHEGPCHRFLVREDLPPSRDLPTAKPKDGTTLDLAAPMFRPGRTYYVRGCVHGVPEHRGGNGVGTALKAVAVNIDWPGMPPSDRVDLEVDNAFSRIEPFSGPPGLVHSVRATLLVRSGGRLSDAFRETLPDRFVVDVYVDDWPVPVHRAVLTGVAGRVATGGLVPVTVQHVVPASAETHLLQYVINADGTIPERDYEDNTASKSFGYFRHSAGATFAPNWGDEGPFRPTGVWSLPSEHGDSHAWVYVEYAGGPLKEGPLCPRGPVEVAPGSGTLACPDSPITPRAQDAPSLQVWTDRPGVRCVGPGGFFEPTLAIDVGDDRGPARLLDSVARRRSIKRFFCYVPYFTGTRGFDTTEVVAEGRLHGVTTRVSGSLRKSWRPTTVDLPTTQLPELVGEVLSVEFLAGLPISPPSGWACGQHPRARFRVHNIGRVPSPPVIGHGWIAPPSAVDPGREPCPRPEHRSWFARDLPPLGPGATFEFVHDFGDETTAAPGSTVHIDVDARFEAVENTKTDNRGSNGVPTR